MRIRIGSSVLRGMAWSLAMGLAMAAGAQAHASGLPPDDTGIVTRQANSAKDRIITVTGSRIRRSDSSSLEPLLTLPGQTIDERSLTNAADALGELPGIPGSVTPAGSQATFGQGVNFINLFGLGSNRTLTLLGGRRVVSSNLPTINGNANPGGQVDLNIVPAILIDRIEIVSIGGAPAYGSDAIAGTVNVILKRRLTGLETRATTGITGEGDGFRWNISAAGGVNFAGGLANLTGAISFDRQQGVTGNARDFYRANVGPAPNPCTVLQAGVCTASNLVSALGPTGRSPANDGRINSAIGFNDSLSDGFPGSILIRNLALPTISRGGVLSNGAGAYGWQFAPDGSLVAYNKGIIYGAPVPGALAIAARASGGDGLALNDYVQIASKLQRLSANLFFTYDLSDRTRLFAEGMFYQGKADELVQQPAFNATLFGGSSGALTFRSDNPFLTAQAKQQLAALGYGSSFQLSRANADLADLTGYSDSKLYRGVGGVEGKLKLGSRDYDYEVALTWGRNDFTDFGQTIDQQRFVNAVNVASSGGQIVCSATATVSGLPAGQTPIADAACVPLNLFGDGAPSAAALAYVLRDTVTQSRLEQFVAEANIGGTPFELFGNPVRFNLGFEHRAEKGSFAPDPFLQQGLGRAAAVTPTTGSYRLNEVFGEVLVPLISPENRLPIAKLEAFARVRHTGSSIGGGFTAWSAGGTLAPIPDTELRGNFTRSFRAPAIAELFTPRTVFSAFMPDLCSSANIGAGPAPDIRRANCSTFLARYPNATPLAAAALSVPAWSGGNLALGNEAADSFTYGAMIRPRFLPGLSLSADYLSIAIRNPISSLTATQISQGCFDNPEFDAADPANGNGFCALIRRDANGQIVSDAQNPGVTTGFVNGKQIRMSAIQFSLDYATGLRGLGLPGRLAVSGQLFHLRHRLVDITGIAPLRSDGLLTDPHWQGQLRLRYAGKHWGISHQINYTGTQIASVTGRGESPNDTREFDRFKPFVTVDSALFVEPLEGLQLTLSVTNLFNRVGEEYNGAIIPATIGDARGRRFALSVKKRG